MLHFDKTIEKKELITPGRYEVTLNADWGKTLAGTNYINCVFKIRKDVSQDFGGRLVFDGIFKSKNTDDFQASKINAILAAIPNAVQDFESYDELIQYINDTNMIVDIGIQKADPMNPASKDRNIINYLSYAPTNVGPVKAEVKEETVEGLTRVDVPEDELAF